MPLMRHEVIYFGQLFSGIEADPGVQSTIVEYLTHALGGYASIGYNVLALFNQS